MVDDSAASEASEDCSAVQKQKRERSRAEFPYADLQSAAELAVAATQKGGGSCDETQLAAWLNQSVGGGTFRSRLSAAKMYGLLAGGNKTLTVTDLGRRVADDTTATAARVEAFLRIALYAALYDKFHGYALPPSAAIERQMVALGVVETQQDRARQAFVKSATQAGFIDPQSGRFVKPGVQAEKPAVVRKTNNGGSDGGDGPPPLHPFIAGLLKTLPEPGSSWPVASRIRWLRTAANIFGLIYDEDGSIKIEAEDDI